MLPLKNDSESCWWQKLTERIKKLSYNGNLRGSIFRRDILWHVDFSKLEWFVLAAMLEVEGCLGRFARRTKKKERLLVVYFGGHTLALQYGGQNYFFLHLVKRLIVTLRRCCKRDHIIFSTISLKFKSKISAQKEVIHSFINHILVTWPATNVLILRKWCGFEKLKHHYFV